MSAKIIPIAPKIASRLTSSQVRPDLQTAFHRTELGHIMTVYGHMVSNGDWKDYAIDMLRERAIFSVYRRASELPIYQIIKTPALRQKQGEFSVVAHGGLILKRGHDLRAVLRVFDRKRFKAT